MKTCKDENDPNGADKLIFKGKHPRYNAQLNEARDLCEKVISMADKVI